MNQFGELIIKTFIQKKATSHHNAVIESHLNPAKKNKKREEATGYK